MSNSFTNQVLAEYELYTKKHTVAVHRLPKYHDDKVAALRLEHVGVHLTKLSTEQAKYLNITTGGPFKADHFRY